MTNPDRVKAANLYYGKPKHELREQLFEVRRLIQANQYPRMLPVYREHERVLTELIEKT